MSFLRWIVGFIFAVLITAFAVMNRHDVNVYLTPVYPPQETSLYLIALYFFASGFLLGGLIVWLNSGSLRRIKREQRKTIKNLEKKLDVANENNGSQKPPSDFFPALPKAKK